MGLLSPLSRPRSRRRSRTSIGSGAEIQRVSSFAVLSLSKALFIQAAKIEDEDDDENDQERTEPSLTPTKTVGGIVDSRRLTLNAAGVID